MVLNEKCQMDWSERRFLGHCGLSTAASEQNFWLCVVGGCLCDMEIFYYGRALFDVLFLISGSNEDSLIAEFYIMIGVLPVEKPQKNKH